MAKVEEAAILLQKASGLSYPKLIDKLKEQNLKTTVAVEEVTFSILVFWRKNLVKNKFSKFF